MLISIKSLLPYFPYHPSLLIFFFNMAYFNIKHIISIALLSILSHFVCITLFYKEKLSLVMSPMRKESRVTTNDQMISEGYYTNKFIVIFFSLNMCNSRRHLRQVFYQNYGLLNFPYIFFNSKGGYRQA